MIAAKTLFDELQRRGLYLATAESLTGGMVGEIFTRIPGASKVYAGGIVAYNNGIKHNVLGVSAELLADHGAVSREVADAMAERCRSLMGVDLALATTGVAGPASDERNTPIGTVFIACSFDGATQVQELLLSGSREKIRGDAAEAVFRLGLQMIRGEVS